jgi:2-keto-3-deoxy-L-rhamnonate aldolase RhmA
LLGVEIEDKYSYTNVDEIVKVPGIGFGEGGPGDMALSFGFKQGDAKAKEIQEKIFAAGKARHLYWLGISDGPVSEASVEQAIKAGRMIGSGEKTAQIGRKITNRPQP